VRSDSRLPTPQARCDPGLQRGRAIAQRRVWSDRVLVDPPAFGQHPDLLHRVEDLPVQELIAELRVEALAVAVLPR